jgi:hypothetical protein
MEEKKNTPLPTQSDTKQNKKMIDDPHFNYIHSTAKKMSSQTQNPGSNLLWNYSPIWLYYSTFLLDLTEMNKNIRQRILRNSMGILIDCVDICNPFVHEYSK